MPNFNDTHQALQPMSSGEYSLLRWRSRRGLLENDILLERFFKQHPALSQQQGLALTHILNLTDRVLMDLLMNKAQIPDELKAKKVDMVDESDEALQSTQQIQQFEQLPAIDEKMEQAIQETIQQLQNS